MPILTRRSLLRGLFAAPAIVAVGNIMPVKLWVPAERLIYSGPIVEGPFRAVFVGSRGDVTLELGNGLVTFSDIPAGTILPINCKSIHSGPAMGLVGIT